MRNPESDVSPYLLADGMWRMQVYRSAVRLSRLVWEDCQILRKDRLLVRVAAQLFRAVGSIRANIAEGYSRSSGVDRAHMYEYGLGSAREAREWYDQARPALANELTEARLALLSEIVRLLLVMIPGERRRGRRATRGFSAGKSEA